MTGSTIGVTRRLVVVSDFCDGHEAGADQRSAEEFAAAWLAGERGPPPQPKPPSSTALPAVVGGYLDRLPLAAIHHGLCDTAEIWSFWVHDGPPPLPVPTPFLIRRFFKADARATPFRSNDMMGHVRAFGPPDILCVLGLGIDESILAECADSIKIYNSIDAPALRVPPTVSRHFDIVLTGAEWQSREVEALHPHIATAVLAIGPEFASPETFFPIGLPKIYDAVYVAAAQPYKRHDILFAALARMPRSIRALCICGYGELGQELRQRAQDMTLNVDFVGPPGVSFEEVNRLMNLAKVGVVCGVDDGAPAILTEYMLAGLPVLANADLRCGLQYITPHTGRIATAAEFPAVLTEMLEDLSTYRSRETAMDRWSWRKTAPIFASILTNATLRKKRTKLGLRSSKRLTK